MKSFTPKLQASTLALTVVALLGGCAGPTSNTQRGAAGGAALGALAGAVIGNNRGSGNAASGAAIGAAAGAVAGGAIGRSKDVRESRAASSSNSAIQSQAATNIVVSGTPPMAPAPMVENQPAQPNPSAVWVSGYWSYENGSNYVWVPGRWEMPPQGRSTFQPPQWTRQGDGYVYTRGYWR